MRGSWMLDAATVRGIATLGMLACLFFGTSGCAAYQATQQPSKKKLEVLSLGVPRSHVIAEIGTPLWSEERDGTTVDVFAFKQGYSKGSKAGRALAHGAADVLTGGLWEVLGIPAESLADGKDVKVEVRYDLRGTVAAVDVIDGQDVISPKPWFGSKKKAAKKPPANTPAETKDDESEEAVASATDDEPAAENAIAEKPDAEKKTR